MTDRRAPEPPAELILRHALEKLRARDGVNLTRMQAGASGTAAPLLSLSAVRRYSSVHDMDIAHAAVAVIGECVRDSLNGTDRIVADAVLALGILANAYLRHGVDQRIVDDIRSDLLSRRRRALLLNWPRLHEAIGATGFEAPSDRTLRGSLEGLVLAELARQLIRREFSSLGSGSAPVADAAGDPAVSTAGRRQSGRVIVVGGAVMDATFKTKMLPQRETSSEAHDFDLTPGGKGLTQAVAAARLGLDVSLIAAVASDRFGDEIIEYLERENVDTSMVKVVDHARTPFTGIIEFELGDSVAVNWRNEREVRLDVRDVERLEPHLTKSDAILVTFELPRESMQRVLSLIHGSRGQRPVIIVTPSQPYTDGNVSGQALAQIDYLVAHPWELGRYAPPDQETFDIDAVARRVLAYGVETLCIPTGGGCTIYSETPVGTFTVPTFPSTYKESSAARDAFCAALAAKLVDGGNEFTERVALWATAAMAAAAADYPLHNSMPTRTRVEQLLTRSRFTVTPRVSANPAVIDADDAADPGGRSRFPHEGANRR